MMNRLFKIALVLILPVATILVIAFSGYRIDPREQVEALAREYIRTFLQKTGTIEQIVPASLPQKFQLEKIKTRYGYKPIKSLTPPVDIWCVHFSSSDPTVPQVVLIAFYDENFLYGYGSGWATHEVTDPNEVLSAVGCKFATQ